jgi:hypothetical protein
MLHDGVEAADLPSALRYLATNGFEGEIPNGLEAEGPKLAGNDVGDA